MPHDLIHEDAIGEVRGNLHTSTSCEFETANGDVEADLCLVD